MTLCYKIYKKKFHEDFCLLLLENNKKNKESKTKRNQADVQKLVKSFCCSEEKPKLEFFLVAKIKETLMTELW